MAAPTQEEVTRVINGYDAAYDASNYADTIICETNLIEGTRYKYILSEENTREEN